MLFFLGKNNRNNRENNSDFANETSQILTLHFVFITILSTTASFLYKRYLSYRIWRQEGLISENLAIVSIWK